MTTTETTPDLAQAVVALMRGVVYRDTHETVWQHLLRLQPQLRDYFTVMGLVVVVDEAEGYAYLQSRPEVDGGDPPPRLVARRSLSFHVSLLLALLRKKLAEFDATNSESRLILTRDQIVEMLRLFLPDSSNEARLVDQIDGHLNKVVELGFLRRINGREQTYEVRRILKAFVDGQWLAGLDQRLEQYVAQLAGDTRDAVLSDAAADPATDLIADEITAQVAAPIIGDR